MGFNLREDGGNGDLHGPTGGERGRSSLHLRGDGPLEVKRLPWRKRRHLGQETKR